MTAIAYRDGIMAADSFERCKATVLGGVKKITRSTNGALGAAAGSSFMCAAFNEWFAGDRREPLKIEGGGDDFCALVVEPDGSVYRLDQRGRKAPADAPFYSDGSGWEICLGAMAAGASAQWAVEIAVEFDGNCGGAVQVERLHPLTAAACVEAPHE